jgi:hypothetical protein
LALTIGRVAQAGSDVLASQLRKVRKDLVFAHPGREIRQDIRYRDPHAANRWLTASFSRLNGDDVLVRHALILPAARAVGLTYHAFSRERPPRAEAEAARRLPRLKIVSAGAICSRRDAVKLAMNEALQRRASERPLVGCYAGSNRIHR